MNSQENLFNQESKATVQNVIANNKIKNIGENNMNEIIKISKSEINGAEVNAVNSREIYEYLGVKSLYAHWIKRAIEKYEFTENEDYIVFAKNDKKPNDGIGRPLLDYIVTLDMAKELCMVSNTPKGKETRKYFIEVEKEFSKPKALSLEDLLKANTKMISNLQGKVISLNEKLEEQKPKVDFYNTVTHSSDAIDIGTVAKVLNKNIGRNQLFKVLRDKGVLMTNNMPKGEFVKRGYFKVSENHYNLPNGSTRIGFKTVVFQKGLDFINRVLNNNNLTVGE